MKLKKDIKTTDKCEHTKNYIKIISLFYKSLTETELDVLSEVLCSTERNTRKFVKTYAISSKNSLSYVRNYLYKLQDKGYLIIENDIKVPKFISPEDKVEFNLVYEFNREGI